MCALAAALALSQAAASSMSLGTSVERWGLVYKHLWNCWVLQLHCDQTWDYLVNVLGSGSDMGDDGRHRAMLELDEGRGTCIEVMVGSNYT
jgi:hypothetical protein